MCMKVILKTVNCMGMENILTRSEIPMKANLNKEDVMVEESMYLLMAVRQAASMKVESKNNRYHGRGKYQSANGECYQGSYKHGLRSGYGKQTYLDGTEYKGKWKNDQKLN